MSKFQELISSKTPVLVDFFADWCGPCKMMESILKEVATNLGSSVKIIKVDVDKNKAAATKYAVRGVPTMLLFKEGEIKWRQSGVLPSNQLVEIIKEHI